MRDCWLSTAAANWAEEALRLPKLWEAAGSTWPSKMAAHCSRAEMAAFNWGPYPPASATPSRAERATSAASIASIALGVASMSAFCAAAVWLETAERPALTWFNACCAASNASSEAPRALWALARAPSAAAIWPRAFPRAPMASSMRWEANEVPSEMLTSAWSRAELMVSTTVSLTVATKVALMVSSKVPEPVSVILGATGPVFMFT